MHIAWIILIAYVAIDLIASAVAYFTTKSKFKTISINEYNSLLEKANQSSTPEDEEEDSYQRDLCNEMEEEFYQTMNNINTNIDIILDLLKQSPVPVNEISKRVEGITQFFPDDDNTNDNTDSNKESTDSTNNKNNNQDNSHKNSAGKGDNPSDY